MPDKILTCKNCHNHFVYSEFERTMDSRNNRTEVIFCPICTSIKASESKHPPKPQKNPPTK